MYGGPRPPMRPAPRPGPGHVQPLVTPEYDDSAAGGGGMLQQGSVLMVYGLNAEKMDCQRLFNLFCLYGNVVRVSIIFMLIYIYIFGILCLSIKLHIY